MAQSNIFIAGAAEVPQLFGGYLENARDDGACIVMTLSSRQLDGTARDAIDKSLSALGFDEAGRIFATVLPSAEQDPDGSFPLDAQALFLLVEGLDPLKLIVTDAAAVDLLSAAYRTSIPVDEATRAFGRPCATFSNLSAMLKNDAGKQKAWALFKTLA